MHQIISHFTDDDLYKLTMCCAVIHNYPRTQVRYQFIDRHNTVYPPGFADELRRQIALLEGVVISDDEIDFMRRRCSYIPDWFYRFLRGYRYDSRWVDVSQDPEGHLIVVFEGAWSDTILLEVKVLAIISELYYEMTGQTPLIVLEAHRSRSFEKGRRLIEAGCVFSDFGTRRRASFAAQHTMVGAMKACQESLSGPGRFVGTSNVWMAMTYDLTPIGTMAHEFVCAIAGMYGPLMANNIAMRAWADTYRGALGTFLYDTYGWQIFSLNFSEDFANMFKGLRVDSGDNRHELDMIVDKYRSLGIDPRSRQVVFSNGLDVDSAIELQRYAESRCQPSFGIGTHLTNDFPGLRPLNIVIKLFAVKITESWPFFCETCKLSEDPGKHTGNPDVVSRFLATLHLPTLR